MPTVPARDDVRQEEVLAICKELYRRWVEKCEDVTVQGLPETTMQEFAEWILAEKLLQDSAYVEKLRTKTECGPAAIDYVATTLADPWKACQLLISIWPVISLQLRVAPQPGVAFLHAALTVAYADGKVAQVQSGYQLQRGAPVLTDGFSIALLQDFCRSMVNTLAHSGLQTLHDYYAAEPAQSPEELQQRPLPPAPNRMMGW